MSALNDLSRSTQRIVCLLGAVVIVAASLAFGAYKAQTALRSDYSVTITQLQ